MRDLLLRKFERAAEANGFDPVPRNGVFVSADGLHVVPVMLRQGRELRIDRRATLQLMVEARRARGPKDEATGAATPMASVVPPQLGE